MNSHYRITLYIHHFNQNGKQTQINNERTKTRFCQEGVESINLLSINRFPFTRTKTERPDARRQTFESSVGPPGVLRLWGDPRRCRRGPAAVSSGFYRCVLPCSCSSCRPTAPPGLRRSLLSGKPTAGVRTGAGSLGPPGPWAPRLRCPARPGRRSAERRRSRVWWWCDRFVGAPVWASRSLPSAIPFRLRIRPHPRLPWERDGESVCLIHKHTHTFCKKIKCYPGVFVRHWISFLAEAGHFLDNILPWKQSCCFKTTELYRNVKIRNRIQHLPPVTLVQ